MAPAGTITEKPVFPAHFPEDKKEAWHKSFNEALEQAKVDNPEGAFQHQAARREANRLLRVPVPKSYADAMKLEKWQILKRETVSAEKLASEGHDVDPTAGDHIKVVTIDGKKHVFQVPAGKRGAAAQEGGDGDGKTGSDKPPAK